MALNVVLTFKFVDGTLKGDLSSKDYQAVNFPVILLIMLYKVV